MADLMTDGHAHHLRGRAGGGQPGRDPVSRAPSSAASTLQRGRARRNEPPRPRRSSPKRAASKAHSQRGQPRRLHPGLSSPRGRQTRAPPRSARCRCRGCRPRTIRRMRSQRRACRSLRALEGAAGRGSADVGRPAAGRWTGRQPRAQKQHPFARSRTQGRPRRRRRAHSCRSLACRRAAGAPAARALLPNPKLGRRSAQHPSALTVPVGSTDDGAHAPAAGQREDRFLCGCEGAAGTGCGTSGRG